jgi:hypothetical protein
MAEPRSDAYRPDAGSVANGVPVSAGMAAADRPVIELTSSIPWSSSRTAVIWVSPSSSRRCVSSQPPINKCEHNRPSSPRALLDACQSAGLPLGRRSKATTSRGETRGCERPAIFGTPPEELKHHPEQREIQDHAERAEAQHDHPHPAIGLESADHADYVGEEGEHDHKDVHDLDDLGRDEAGEAEVAQRAKKPLSCGDATAFPDGQGYG